jgi:hypothetical protein
MVTRFYALAPDKSAAHAEEEYVTAIRHAVQPEIWAGGGAYVGKVPGAIVVRCPPTVQRQIHDLLEACKALAPSPPRKPIVSSVIPVVG